MTSSWASTLVEKISTTTKLFWKGNRQFFILITCIFFFKSAVGDINTISGASMQPTLFDGDRVWVHKLAYDVRIPFTGITLASISDPKRGDVIIFDSEKAGKRLVKRIVGIPGDILLMQNSALMINRNSLDYKVVTRDQNSLIVIEDIPEKSHRIQLSNSYINRASRKFGPHKVPPDQYFVLGDNRDNSSDSRIYSFIQREELVGRSSAVIFSLDRENNYLPRRLRFLTDIY